MKSFEYMQEIYAADLHASWKYLHSCPGPDCKLPMLLGGEGTFFTKL